jgi:hypothetical protein
MARLILMLGRERLGHEGIGRTRDFSGSGQVFPRGLRPATIHLVTPPPARYCSAAGPPPPEEESHE